LRSPEEGPEVGTSPAGLREEVLRAGLELFATDDASLVLGPPTDVLREGEMVMF